MTQYLPPNLLALFAPRDPVPYLPPLDKLPHEKKFVPYSGVSQYLQEFEDPKDTPPPTRVETKDERKERKRKERAEQVAYKLEQDLALWDPTTDPQCTSDPFKTLFVARINYDTSESKLRREFEVYGPVKKIHMVMNKRTTKPRGFAFIEYEHERDMHSSYKHADGKKIDGRRVLVDVERSRTVKGWRPRRLGGGLGGTRKGGPDENTKYSGRDEMSGAVGRDRSLSRERDRGRRRSRSLSTDRIPRRARSGSRDRDDRGGSREKEREPRRRRSRSRDRKKPRSRSRERRKRSRSRERKRSRDREDEEEGGSRRRRRSRSRDRKRSRSRERKRRRSRSRDRKRSRSRERRARDAGAYGPDFPVMVKSEPIDTGYDAYQQAMPAGDMPDMEDTKDFIKEPPSPPPNPNGNLFPQYEGAGEPTNEYGTYQDQNAQG